MFTYRSLESSSSSTIFHMILFFPYTCISTRSFPGQIIGVEGLAKIEYV